MNLRSFLEKYSNTAECNDSVFETFTDLTDTIPYLKEQKDHIQKENLGFGDRAFYYMWYLLLNDVHSKKKPVNLLEIGVFKGQVISLWSRIAKEERLDVRINGISPLEGKQRDKSRIVQVLKYLTSKQYRIDWKAGNFYNMEDYLGIIKGLFAKFNLDFGSVNLMKGFSTVPAIINHFAQDSVDILYIDGDHSYDGALADIRNFGPKVSKGGYMIVDDASCNIPGSKFWKGHQSVSDACEQIDSKLFVNVLNVGHNRVYQRL